MRYEANEQDAAREYGHAGLTIEEVLQNYPDSLHRQYGEQGPASHKV